MLKIWMTNGGTSTVSACQMILNVWSLGLCLFIRNLVVLRKEIIFIFKKLSKFALQMLSLPVSNADAERLFSKLNLIKTDIRNRLSIKTVNSLIYIAEAVNEQEACYLYQPTDEMINYFK